MINRLPNELRKMVKDIERFFRIVEDELDGGSIDLDQYSYFFQLIHQSAQYSKEQR